MKPDPISEGVWEEKRKPIQVLYQDEGWPLKQVIRQIRSDNFNPSETQLRSKLKKWGVTKPFRRKSKSIIKSPPSRTHVTHISEAQYSPASVSEQNVTNANYDWHSPPAEISLAGHDNPIDRASTSAHFSSFSSKDPHVHSPSYPLQTLKGGSSDIARVVALNYTGLTTVCPETAAPRATNQFNDANSPGVNCEQSVDANAQFSVSMVGYDPDSYSEPVHSHGPPTAIFQNGNGETHTPGDSSHCSPENPQKNHQGRPQGSTEVNSQGLIAIPYALYQASPILDDASSEPAPTEGSTPMYVDGGRITVPLAAWPLTSPIDSSRQSALVPRARDGVALGPEKHMPNGDCDSHGSLTANRHCLSFSVTIPVTLCLVRTPASGPTCPLTPPIDLATQPLDTHSPDISGHHDDVRIWKSDMSVQCFPGGTACAATAGQTGYCTSF
ncbi:hypothetical protein BJX66DRAFT_312884 [Aspergillus keveii]|uniref:Clr5 domain-containing protein n=1 Tax=Aspergillus keveii TaxID=714993 RepID=A0ABR4FSY5_9EURO